MPKETKKEPVNETKKDLAEIKLMLEILKREIQAIETKTGLSKEDRQELWEIHKNRMD